MRAPTRSMAPSASSKAASGDLPKAAFIAKLRSLGTALTAQREARRSDIYGNNSGLAVRSASPRRWT